MDTYFQIEKVKSIRNMATFPSGNDLGIDFRRATIGLCDVVLELLAIEKDRQESYIRLKAPNEE